jgi:Ca2+-transporting ATPase
MSKKALRVLGAAYKDIDSLPSVLNSANVENNLVFCGLVGMIDPPRPEVKRAVNICRKAGIKPVMITGDHVTTAMAIAKELGIIRGSEKVATGEELNKMSQQELDKNINQYSVFARVTPEHKVKIVKAFQANKHVVAMTGDGVNDAPALKMADIGCAMGIQGTDVAKGAADMILTDDNFASIVEAVREGRGIYQNIRKAIHFLLSSNIGEILTIFTAFFLCLPTPLLPIQLLWVNLVTDSLPALSLGVDTIDEDIMDKKPINPNKGLFSDGLAFKIIIEGFMIGALALLSYNIGRSYFDISAAQPVIGRTMAFCVLSLSQLVHAFNARSDYSLFHIGVFSNKSLIASFLICGFMQISVVSIPPLAAIFKVVPLTLLQWELVLGISLMPLILVEIVKLFTSKKRNRINNLNFGKQ